MSVEEIVAEIDEHIVKLTEELGRYTAVRNLLTGNLPEPPSFPKKAYLPPKKRGRPPGSTKKVFPVLPTIPPAPLIPRKRTLSPEGRVRISEALKLRWASRKATAKKIAPKK